MRTAFGVLILVLGLLAWIGQLLSTIAPSTAVRLNLMEDEETVEPVYWADIRGEALWDMFTLWTLVVAGFLLILDVPAWAYFGLVGGGVYVYFGGRGVLTRLEMRRRRFRIGNPQNVSLGLVMLAVWAVLGALTIAYASASLVPE